MALAGWQIALIVIGSVLLFLILLYLFLRWYTWRKVNRIDPSMPRVKIDAKEYAGKWYEIAHNPEWFEYNCKNTTAAYIPTKENRIRVVNRCFRNGTWSESLGWAYPTDYDGVYGVSFFPGIYGNYTVTYRDSDTSIVTNTDKTSLWILSRKKEITPQKKAHLLKWLEKENFNTSKLQFTDQTNVPMEKDLNQNSDDLSLRV
jgi:apolipoprotein D and lipocalin family protein